NGPPLVTDIAVQGVCTTDSSKACTNAVFTGQPWHTLFTVANLGQKPVDNWSFDLTLLQPGVPPMPIKSQISGPPLPVGGTVTINWPGPFFDPSQVGPWTVAVD